MPLAPSSGRRRSGWPDIAGAGVLTAHRNGEERSQLYVVGAENDCAMPRGDLMAHNGLRIGGLAGSVLSSARRGPLPSRELLGPAREVARTFERAEEVRGPLVRQASSRVVGVNRHLADGVDGEPVCRRPGPHRREEVDRLAYVAKLLAAARLVKDAVDVRRFRSGMRGEQHLAADGLPGDARREIDGRAEEVAVAFDTWAVMKPDAHRRRPVDRHQVIGYAQPEQDGLSRAFCTPGGV